MKLRIAWLVLLAVPLAACGGGGNLQVQQPAASTFKVHSVHLEYDNKVEGIPQRAANYLQARMDESFFSEDPAFGRGSDVKIRYRFSSSSRGTPISRAVLGSKTVLEAEIIDSEGKILSRMQSRQDIKLFAGISQSAINRAVAEIRNYAVAHFQARAL